MSRDEKLLEEFGRRVKAFRDERGFSQEQLAELADISAKHVGELERGLKEPGLVAVLGLARALDVDLVVLVPFRAGEDPFPPRPTYKEWLATLHSGQQLVELATRMARSAEHFRAARPTKASRLAASRRGAKSATARPKR